ncbi:MAG: hypothetical protein ABL867_09620 [Rickettsiales bacterium]
MSSGKESDNLKGLRILDEVLPPDSPSQPRRIYVGQFNCRRDIKNSEQIQKLEHFHEAVQAGVLPDGEVLVWMADAILEYLDGRALYLDSAFCLKSLTRAGNPASQYKENKKLSEMVYTVALFMEDEGISKEQAIEKTLTLYEIEPEKTEAYIKRFQRNIPNNKKTIQTVRANRKNFPNLSDK